ncbi:MAG: hypothetical protein QM614_16350 [Ottowia sp.]
MAALPRKFIDLPIHLENDVASAPPAFAPKIEYFNHRNSFEQMAPFFPGLKQEDLEALPPDGFTISCLPHRIRGASAGWTRAVAIFDDALMPAAA